MLFGEGSSDVLKTKKVAVFGIGGVATEKTVGMLKTAAFAARAKEINGEAKIIERNEFFLPETADRCDFDSYDYVVDAIDTVSGKLGLAEICYKTGVPIISSMGAGNKLHPELFKVADIYETSVCPLAKTMRRELKKRGIEKLKVVYSEEQPITPHFQPQSEVCSKRQTPASCAFVPGVAGLIIAGEVIKDLLKIE